ncbi:DUF5658 family protein [Halorussus litoreus]|uniref:DUF5658 family protein n=1 Tax=Halorussus litoreus TaxID=1710536 RepID=UPI001E56C0F3|nr:DUF5658 family protein [Halorussus litoreus]
MSSDPQYSSTLTATRNRAITTLSGVGRVERALWLLVGVGLLADLLTTYYGLQIGLTESNPVARTAIHRFGFAAMVGMKLGAVGVGVACRRLVTGRHALLVPAGLAVPWLAAALVNLSLYAVVT